MSAPTVDEYTATMSAQLARRDRELSATRRWLDAALAEIAVHTGHTVDVVRLRITGTTTTHPKY